jgi:hypothetical protein
MNIITKRLKDFEIRNIDRMLEQENRNYADFIRSKDVLIIPPEFGQKENHNLADRIDECVQNGGKLIKFEYQIERGSLIYLEGEIFNILNGKS